MTKKKVNRRGQKVSGRELLERDFVSRRSFSAYVQQSQQQLQKLMKQVQEMEKHMQITGQMINQLARPDLRLNTVQQAFFDSPFDTLVICIAEGVAYAVMGNHMSKLTEEAGNGDLVLDVGDGKVVQIKNGMWKMMYAQPRMSETTEESEEE